MNRAFAAFVTLALALIGATTLSAQTLYQFQTGTIDYINYGGQYANVFWDDNPVTINGVPFYVSITMHTDSNGTCISSCNIQFWNLQTMERDDIPYAGSLSTLVPTQPTTMTGSFSSGAWSGSFVVNISVPKRVCGHYCTTIHTQSGSTLTLN